MGAGIKEKNMQAFEACCIFTMSQRLHIFRYALSVSSAV